MLKAESIELSHFDKLSNFINSINSNKSFIGSDHYLDTVIEINKSLDRWIKEINAITNYFKNYLPTTKEQILEIIHSLYEVYKTLNISLLLIKKNEIAYKSLRTRILALEVEANQIKKIILNITKVYLRNTFVTENTN